MNHPDELPDNAIVMLSAHGTAPNIEKEFNHALIGIKKLPSVARAGVYLSYNYYRELYNKIKLLDSERLKRERISVSNFKKFIIFLSSYINPL